MKISEWKPSHPEVEYFGFKFLVNPKFKWIAIDSNGAIHVWTNKPIARSGSWVYDASHDLPDDDLHCVGYFQELAGIDEIIVVEDWQETIAEIKE